jgi:glycosyltransferase involved in cell wall biosynthesis
MKIMMVFPYLDPDSPEAADILSWGWARALAARGHRVEAFTTCSARSAVSQFGYALWNNYFPPGEEEQEGVVIRRFPVRRRSTLLKRIYRRRFEERGEREEMGAEPAFAGKLASSLEEGEGCLVSGWYHLEGWNDGPARWSTKKAWVAAAGKSLEKASVRLLSPRLQRITLSVEEGPRESFATGRWEEREVGLTFPERDRVLLRLEAERLLKPRLDPRRLGLALRSVRFSGKEGEFLLDLESDLDWWRSSAPEEKVFRVFWPLAAGGKGKKGRAPALLAGPWSPKLERVVMREAGRFDLVAGFRAPFPTLEMASRAAAMSGKPFVAFPFFYPRDIGHYDPSVARALERADLVVTSSPSLAEALASLEKHVFPRAGGLDREELAYRCDPVAFRKRYGLGEEPLILLVGSGSAEINCPLALETLRLMREGGSDARFLMVGLDENEHPILDRNFLNLGVLPREERSEAFAACDLFLHASSDESDLINILGAWKAKKPLLAWSGSLLAGELIEPGVDGFLCESAGELARAMGRLLQDKELALKMGSRGKEKVVKRFFWESIAERFEREMENLVNERFL